MTGQNKDKKPMSFYSQCGIIFAVCVAGDIVSRLLSGFIPANVMGMVILLVLLFTKVIKAESFEGIEKVLLGNLPFFFIPAGVGLMVSVAGLGNNLISFAAVAMVTTVVIMIITGRTTQFLIRLRRKDIPSDSHIEDKQEDQKDAV